MKSMKSAVWLTALLMLCAGAAWAAVIFVALQVSGIVLDTLHQIVELAGI